MSFSRLRALIRADSEDKSPLWQIVYWYGFLAAFTSVVALVTLSVAPAMITGRAIPPSTFRPPVWLLLICFLLGGLLGAVCGWCVGRFVDAAASDNPRLAFPLLFLAFFLPPACILSGWMVLISISGESIGKPLASLGVLVAGCAINCYSFHRNGWPSNFAANGDQSRDSDSSAASNVDQP